MGAMKTLDIEQRRELPENQCPADDLCGLCGEPGADKYHHPVYWPGEREPDGDLVHAACEQEECARAHAALSDQQRAAFLRGL